MYHSISIRQIQLLMGGELVIHCNVNSHVALHGGVPQCGRVRKPSDSIGGVSLAAVVGREAFR